MKNAPVESDPEITMRPATSSTRAWATSGRKVRSGTYSARWRFAERASEDGVRGRGRPIGATPLLRERLDDMDTRDRLLRDRGHVCEGLLHVAEHRVGDAVYRYAVRAITGAIATATSASCQL